jgi:serine/threonine protein kinase
MPDRTLGTITTLPQLIAQISEYGLVPAEDLASLATEAQGDLLTLSQKLSAKGLLTEFQIEALVEGRGDSLRLGNYDILSRLGAGGMGTVFKARHRRMKRIVAIKVLAAKLSENPVFVKRFQREVETIAALGHPNIVMAYDADEAEAGHFLVMEFVNGTDLAVYAERNGTLTLSHAVDCVLQAAKGLAYAHSQGIIHRDVKPHNLMFDELGLIKLTDLGLARLNSNAEGSSSGSDVTMAGGVMGTADYMPPEQAVDSSSIDDRADIYSLGCTLFYLLAGRPPFQGNSIMAILLQHRDGAIPTLKSVCPDSPERLEQLFQRMLAKKPESRVQTMAEVVSELTAIAEALPRVSGTVRTSITPAASATAQTLPGTASLATTQSDQTIMMDGATLAMAVLIVEPSRVQASIIRSYLQQNGILSVDSVQDMNSALEAIRVHKPQAVISAIFLADGSGVELAQRTAAELAGDAPGFVLVTSQSHEAESNAPNQGSRIRMLQKPFSADQMLQALQSVNRRTGSETILEASTNTNARPPGKRNRSELKVLIADDSSTARMKVRNVLQQLGFSQFVEVPDGAYAIAVASRENCDLIVTDYNMPLMDGRALVSYLKQNVATSSIPIMMVTTESDPQVLDPVRKMGVVAIFCKAFPAEEVAPILDSLFS